MSSEFCTSMVSKYDSLAPLLNEHVDDYDGILPHVFFGDVTRHLTDDGKQRKEIVQYLEDALADPQLDEGIKNVVCASFVENIETLTQLEALLVGVVGNAIAEQWHRQHPESE